MDHQGIRAFNPKCSMCNQLRVSVKTLSPVRDFKFVFYRVCTYCDRGNPRMRGMLWGAPEGR